MRRGASAREYYVNPDIRRHYIHEPKAAYTDHRAHFPSVTDIRT